MEKSSPLLTQFETARTKQMSNSSSISHFLLLPLADTRQLQLLHFCLFLGISLAALLANGLIISAVACGHLLHMPMFFFLLNLALTDLGLHLHHSEVPLLTIMCYDRYVSICKPLHYGTLLAAELVPTWQQLPGPVAFLTACCSQPIHFPCPCARIFRAVLRIPSEQGRHKAFSTCLPHLAVVSLFLSTADFAYLKPFLSISSPSLDLALSVLYSVVPPALNPLIYTEEPGAQGCSVETDLGTISETLK
ncbi:hypothetical protein DUI87_19379 [Hirundo rustica rustica]|uniref:G-protein coupled receptors family 1 profile domain-containing protein n=1 Tax=Hirundo rustica rustica TaxID=333673 RepID=A0A3M0JSQ4_HIRRU|nr:hypothetical protein DUI87_19379 [Hirundo rustica rustica]